MEGNQFLIICVLQDSHSILVRVTVKLLDIHLIKVKLQSQNPEIGPETRSDILLHQQKVYLFLSRK
jgi:hypothetical protein